MTKINHLEGIKSSFVQTERLRVHTLMAGNPENPAILFLHGNMCTATMWEELMQPLSEDYFCVAPDLRGFGQTEQDKIIDATRGMGDWLDDIGALIKTLDLAPLHLVGHSLGGFVCWGIMGKYADKLRTTTLIAPGPPMGFGGVHGKEGIPNNDDFSGSGGGIVVKEFADRIIEKDRSSEDPLYSPRNTMNRLFWKEGFRAKREEDILSAMLQIHTGEKKYPGDYTSSEYWPGVAPGKFGPVNAISSKYNRHVLDELVQAKDKPPILWIQGMDDHIISDHSYSDPGYQGKLNLRNGWPGEQQYPPQPMVSQIEYALDKYQSTGGSATRSDISDCGHTPFIEKPDITRRIILDHLKQKVRG